MLGKVKWFNEQRGYGFINIKDNPKDIFVHYSEIKGEGFKTLNEGDTIEFDLVDTDRGIKATNIIKVS